MAKEVYDRVNNLIKEEGATNAYGVKFNLEDSYSELGFFSKFFSYLLPNSWTEAGRLRNQMAECDKAFKDNGFKPKDVKIAFERSYMNNDAVDVDLYKENKLEQIKKSSWTARSENAKTRKFMRDAYIAESLDLEQYAANKGEGEVDDIEDEMDEPEREQITVEEASASNKQSKENVKVNDAPTKVVENQKNM